MVEDMVEARVTSHDENIVESVVSQGEVFHIQDGGRKGFDGAS